MIGRFGGFSRNPTCSYVYLNFETLYLDNEIPESAAAKEWIQNKKRRFAGHARLYDLVLDFHFR